MMSGETLPYLTAPKRTKFVSRRRGVPFALRSLGLVAVVCLLNTVSPSWGIADTLPVALPPATTPPSQTVIPKSEGSVKIDPDALSLLEKTQAKMLSLKSFQADFVSVVLNGTRPMTVDGMQPLIGTVTALKPNLFKYEAWDAIRDPKTNAWVRRSRQPSFISLYDGKALWNLYFALVGGKTTRNVLSYSYKPQPPPGKMTDALAGKPWASFFGFSYDNVDFPSPTDIANAVKSGQVITITFDGDESVAGIPCRRVRVFFGPEKKDAGYNGTVTVYDIDSDLTIRSTSNDRLFKPKVPGDMIGKITLTNVRTDAPIPDPVSVFHFTPPAKATLDGPLYPGLKAPDLVTVDDHGKTVRLSHFRGKVILLAISEPAGVEPIQQAQRIAVNLRKEGLPVTAIALYDPAWWAPDRRQFPHVVFLQDKGSAAYGKYLCQESLYVIDAKGTICYGANYEATVWVNGRTQPIVIPDKSIEDAVRAALKVQPGSL